MFLCPKLLAADFQLADIPRGKEITLPNPATTIVSPTHAFHVASTDNGQTLKLSLEGGGVKDKLSIKVYGKNQENIVYFMLSKVSPVVYSVKGIDNIRIVPSYKGRIRSKIKVESNRPLTIGH
jgi:hypothetical protein